MRAPRPNSQHPRQHPQLTAVLPHLGAAGKLGPGHGSVTAGPQCADATGPRAAAAALARPLRRGPGRLAAPTGDSGLGTLPRVHAPFRDSG